MVKYDACSSLTIVQSTASKLGPLATWSSTMGSRVKIEFNISMRVGMESHVPAPSKGNTQQPLSPKNLGPSSADGYIVYSKGGPNTISNVQTLDPRLIEMGRSQLRVPRFRAANAESAILAMNVDRAKGEKAYLSVMQHITSLNQDITVLTQRRGKNMSVRFASNQVEVDRDPSTASKSTKLKSESLMVRRPAAPVRVEVP
ncbi:hypothetical protein DFP72DRAFT_856458 [Ephemerocybe angulata]|uniref:Uncharacterized protein n=1 Tax=Ephemerocybe angulata TaxID=980116 RepID=A0A8H6HFL1_9AGAR|nr:hypothetical protein DFP72DRAFT_856458 [Tulosesus angulatus]